jgi:dephospho-CoA kinase
MFLIGLTGGIAAGKSTVADHWQSLGAVHLDADAIARQVVQPGTPGLSAIEREFGTSVLNENGSLNRAALAEIVFNDPVKRKVLEAITHPLVQAETRRQIDSQRPEALVVYNVPLLVEANVNLPFDRIVTVEAPLDDQVKRLMAHRDMTAEQAYARIRNQATPAQRANASDFILSSNQDIGLLLKDAGKLWLQFEREAAEKLRLQNTGSLKVGERLTYSADGSVDINTEVNGS